MQKIDGIIVDSDTERRMRLRQACMQIPQLARVGAVSTLEEALRRLAVSEDVDFTAVFVSVRFDRTLIGEFIAQAKKTFRGQDSAYILVLQARDQDGQGVAQCLLEGADGFLLEPFSVQSLVEMTDLAMVIKKQRQEAREEAMVSLLINDALTHLDLAAERLVRGDEGGPELKYFRELKTNIQALNERMARYYYQMLPGKLGNLAPPTLTLKQEESGKVSTNRRAHLRAMERLRARGLDLTSFDKIDDDAENGDQSHLWELKETDVGSRALCFKCDLYDKPTSDALLKFVEKLLLQEPVNIEIDLSFTRVLSGYAIAQLLISQKRARHFQRELIINLPPQGFNREAFEILGLSKILKCRDK